MANALILEPLVPASVLASSTASGRRAANVARDEFGLVWRSDAGAASQWLLFDLGGDTALDTISLHGLFGAQADWLWTVDLASDAQGPFTGAFWAGSAEPLLAGTAMPVSGMGKALWQAPPGAPAVARYVRLTFSGLSGAAVEVSVAVLAAKIQLGRNFRFGAAFGVRPLGTVDWSARGVMLRRRGPKLRGVGISFFNIYRDEAEELVQPMLERVGNDVAIAVVVDPAPHPQRMNRMAFGTLSGNLGTIWQRPNGLQMDINLVALD